MLIKMHLEKEWSFTKHLLWARNKGGVFSPCAHHSLRYKVQLAPWRKQLCYHKQVTQLSSGGLGARRWNNTSILQVIHLDYPTSDTIFSLAPASFTTGRGERVEEGCRWLETTKENFCLLSPEAMEQAPMVSVSQASHSLCETCQPKDITRAILSYFSAIVNFPFY